MKLLISLQKIIFLSEIKMSSFHSIFYHHKEHRNKVIEIVNAISFGHKINVICAALDVS